MSTSTHQIEKHIERTREALGSNLNELEQKVKAVADWKEHFRTWPMASLGLAFGGGLLLAAVVGGRSRPSRGVRSANYSTAPERLRSNYRGNGALEAWENVKGALINVATTRLLGFVEEVIPGFRKKSEYTHVEAGKTEPRPSQSNPEYWSENK